MGKFDRRSGTDAYFVKKTGEPWSKPVEIRSGAWDAVQRAESGKWYQLTIDDNNGLVELRDPPPRDGGGGGAGPSGRPTRGTWKPDPSPSACSITAALCAAGQIKGLAQYLECWTSAYRHVQRVQQGEAPQEAPAPSTASRVFNAPESESDADIPF